MGERFPLLFIFFYILSDRECRKTKLQNSFHRSLSLTVPLPRRWRF